MIQFVNITKEEFLAKKTLYKRLPLERALNWLNTSSIWFSNPKEWKDPWEKRFIDAKYILGGKEKKFGWLGRLYCSCFSQTASSEALWHSYSTNSICVEFRINKECLLNVLEKITDYSVYIGKVEYLKTKELKKTHIKDIPFTPPITIVNSSVTAARLFLLKRVSFKYEDEIRIILVDKKMVGEKGVAIKYDCAHNELIQRIFLDPELQKDTAQMLVGYLEDKYGFKPKPGRTRIVRQSVLYKEQPIAEISLD